MKFKSLAALALVLSATLSTAMPWGGGALTFINRVLAASAIQTATFEVKGMTCRSCEKAATSALKKLEGVQNVSFQLKKNGHGVRLAEVTYAADSKVTRPQLIKAVVDAGYEASLLQ